MQSSKFESNNALTSVKQRFSNFFNTATNGEKDATLSEELVPILNGRQIFDPAVVSQSEKVLMDYAFRIALLSVCAESSNIVDSIVLETPDEVIDGSYLPSFAQALRSFSTNLSIIITTFSTEMLDLLIQGYDIKGKDKFRLTSLLSPEGTLTQMKYFEPKLFKYLSETA